MKKGRRDDGRLNRELDLMGSNLEINPKGVIMGSLPPLELAVLDLDLDLLEAERSVTVEQPSISPKFRLPLHHKLPPHYYRSPLLLLD